MPEEENMQDNTDSLQDPIVLDFRGSHTQVHRLMARQAPVEVIKLVVLEEVCGTTKELN